MKLTRILYLSRLFFGLLGLAAVVTEIATLVERGVFVWYNFFSYFTIESNLAVALFLLFYATSRQSEKAARSPAIQLIRGGLALYILMTGVIFLLLLSSMRGLTPTAVPWDNIVLHYVMPIAFVLDWIIDPPHVKITWRGVSIWLLYPLMYVAWALFRGSMDNWYPYPFLDVSRNGYAPVLITLLGMLAGVVAVGWVFTLARKGNSA